MFHTAQEETKTEKEARWKGLKSKIKNKRDYAKRKRKEKKSAHEDINKLDFIHPNPMVGENVRKFEAGET